MRNWIKNSCYVLLGLIGLKSTDANAVDMALCIGGIAGNPADSKSDTGCIDVLAWSWGVSNSGQAGQPGSASFQDISLTKFHDNASTFLLNSVASGKGIPELQLRVRASCGVPDCVGTITSQYTAPAGSIVSSVSTGGSGGESRLTENVTLNFPAIEWCYVTVDEGGTPAGGLVCGSWDLSP